LAEISRPPPDVTQYQGVQLHPDIAHHPAGSVQPDLMPHYTVKADEEGEQQGSILQSSVSAENFSDKFSS
jgi:hypothetical protein